METPKEKAIREAYGEHWEQCKYKIDSDGWLECHELKPSLRMISDLLLEGKVNNPYKFRPKSLQGIETNNGWTRIESEADLPTETKSYHVMYKDGSIIQHHFSTKSDFDRILFLEEFTHWQEILIPNQPIY